MWSCRVLVWLILMPAARAFNPSVLGPSALSTLDTHLCRALSNLARTTLSPASPPVSHATIRADNFPLTTQRAGQPKQHGSVRSLGNSVLRRPGALSSLGILSNAAGAKITSSVRRGLGAGGMRMIQVEGSGDWDAAIKEPARSLGVENLSEVLHGLNPVQQRAVIEPPGPIVVDAGPGSGKTMVLTKRIMFMIRQGTMPSNILAVTFTNKAANEMRQRMKTMLGLSSDRDLLVTIGTFHSVCVRILRKYGEAIALPENFLIFDTNQQKKLVKEALEKLKLDPEEWIPNAMLSAISRLKSEGLTPRTAMQSKAVGAKISSEKGRKFYLETVTEVWKEYQALLQQNRAVDFDDLLVLTLHMLKTHKNVLSQVQDQYHHLLVDEWQDTNSPQYDLIKLIAGENSSPSVFVVGDIDQSIYSWRGADFRNVNRFASDFVARRFVLEDNYRSSRNIVDFAQSLIETNAERVDKGMRSSNNRGPKIRFCASDSDVGEATFVARQIQYLVSEKLVPGGYPNIAVMYRMNAQSRTLEEIFIAERIPYHLVGATTFYERKEIKDILAYLRLLTNTQDSTSLMRIINVPKRAIGKASIDKLLKFSKDNGITPYDTMLGLRRMQSFNDGAEIELDNEAERTEGSPYGDHGVDRFAPGGVWAEEVEELFKKNTRHSLVKFVSLIEMLRSKATLKSPSEVIDLIIAATEFQDYVLKEETGEERWSNVLELKNAADATDQKGEEGLLDFLMHVSLNTNEEDLKEEIKLDVDVKKNPKVKLLTFHASKGLEFDTVFMVGMEDGCLPHARAVEESEGDGLEEERRLGYVGITRAKQRLHLTLKKKKVWGQGKYTDLKPSRFLLDLPLQDHRMVSDDMITQEAIKFIQEEGYTGKSQDKFMDTSGARQQPKASARSPFEYRAARVTGVQVKRKMTGAELIETWNKGGPRESRDTRSISTRGPRGRGKAPASRRALRGPTTASNPFASGSSYGRGRGRSGPASSSRVVAVGARGGGRPASPFDSPQASRGRRYAGRQPATRVSASDPSQQIVARRRIKYVNGKVVEETIDE